MMMRSRLLFFFCVQSRVARVSVALLTTLFLSKKKNHPLPPKKKTTPTRRGGKQTMRQFIRHNEQHKTMVGSTYGISLDTLGSSAAEQAKQHLTLVPRSGFGPPSPPVVAWYVKDNYLHVPRFYGLERYGAAVVDERSMGAPLPAVPFDAKLTDVQSRAVDVVQTKHLNPDADGGAIICLPCGMGKTVLAVYIVTQVLRRKACILVHKGIIRDQWKEAFEKFSPGLRVGIIQGQKWDLHEYDVVIAMVLTLAKKNIGDDVLEDVGTVVCDECHHYAAPVMSKAMRAFKARYVLGLTATKERPDGLTPLLHWSMGAEAFRAERDGGESVRVSMALFKKVVKDMKNKDGKPLTSIMTTRLALNDERNEFIATRIVQMNSNGRVIIVLSDRIEQLKILYSKILNMGIAERELGLFYSATPEVSRPEQLSRNIVLCSYGMANEGLDKREADTCVMASPKARVTQCVGRVQRPCATKQVPLVLDIVDDNASYNALRWARQRLYAKEKYDVQVVEVKQDMDNSVWFK